MLKIEAASLDADGQTRITKVVNDAGETSTLVPIEGKPCEFTLDTNTHVAIGPNGVGLATDVLPDNSYAISLLFPEQTGDAALSAADLIGTFNVLNWLPTSGSIYGMWYGAFHLNADGMSVQSCPTDPSSSDACSEPSDRVPASISAASSGGGYVGSGLLNGTRFYGFKFVDPVSNITTVSLVGHATDADGVFFLSKQQSLMMPRVNSISHSWGYTVTASNVANQGLTTLSSTVTQVDGETITRRTTDDVLQTIRNNAPLPGFRKREEGSGVTPAIQMSLGSGLFLTSRLVAPDSPRDGLLSLSLSKPEPSN